jgi:hypothetical protein
MQKCHFIQIVVTILICDDISIKNLIFFLMFNNLIIGIIKV